MEIVAEQRDSHPETVRPSRVPLYNGLASVDDLHDSAWNVEVGNLASRGLGNLGIGGWQAHWARIWEFPWVYNAITAFASPAREPEVLESGCGVTPIPYWLAGDGFRVTGVDLDSSYEPKWSAIGVPCRPDPSFTRFERGDMLKLPRQDGSIDVVYSVSAIEHTSDPVMAVSEMLRILRPGGHIVFTLDVDICSSEAVPWPQFMQIQDMLQRATVPDLPIRHVTPHRLLTFENRTLAPQSSTRLLMKHVLDHVGLKQRRNLTTFGWAGTKR
jgi:SAM-dependent methyltransferase